MPNNDCKQTDELCACPFCGEIPYTTNIQTWCTNEDCPVYDSVFTANIWNRRPIEDALRAELARKDDEIKVLDELVEAEKAAHHFYGRILVGIEKALKDAELEVGGMEGKEKEHCHIREGLKAARAKLAALRGER